MKILKIWFDNFMDHDLVHYYVINFFDEPFILIKSKIYLNVEYNKFQDLGIYFRPKS